jgi:hypothetical protein
VQTAHHAPFALPPVIASFSLWCRKRQLSYLSLHPRSNLPALTLLQSK